MQTTSRRVKVLTGQNVYDIALREYGDVSAVVQLMNDNLAKITSLDASLIPGDYLIIDTTKIVNAEVVKYFENLQYTINTGDEAIVGADFNDDFNNDFLIDEV